MGVLSVGNRSNRRQREDFHPRIRQLSRVAGMSYPKWLVQHLTLPIMSLADMLCPNAEVVGGILTPCMRSHAKLYREYIVALSFVCKKKIVLNGFLFVL